MDEKYVVFLFTCNGGIEEIEVVGMPGLYEDGVLSFGRNNFVFNRGSWSYFKKVEE